MLGMIFPLVTLDPPPNVLPCDGSTYLRSDFPELFAVLDTVFIVDSDHFVVPDLRGRTIIGGGGVYSNADTGGEEAHQLTESEIPNHVHSIPLTTTTLAVEPGEIAVLSPIPILTSSTGSTGGDSSHNNMQPFFALNYGIVAS
jgi:microcystin-dependent protein